MAFPVYLRMVQKTVPVWRAGERRRARNWPLMGLRGGAQAPLACCSCLLCRFKCFKIKTWGKYIFIVKKTKQATQKNAKSENHENPSEMTTVDPLRTSFQVLVLSLSVDLLSVYPSVKWSFWFCLALFLPFLFFPEDFGGRNQPICL